MGADGHAATAAAESLCPVAELDLARTRSIGCQDRKPISNMEWALMDFPGTHDIVEHESRINYMLPKYDMATVCT
jgi:hypothetical protein